MNRKEKTMQGSAGYVDPDTHTDNHDKIMIWLDGIMTEMVEKSGDKRFVIDKVWEKPILAKSGFICGYIDLFVRIGERDLESSLQVTRRIEEAERCKRRGGDVEERELSADPQLVERSLKNVCFEVKSKISNVGECIRQIRQYQSFTGDYVEYVVVCPDDRFKEVLKSQGIGFIKAPSEVLHA